MPYTQKNLPTRVKKMGAKKKRQWMHTWNSIYKKTGDEGRAFAGANSVTSKKELDMSKEKALSVGDKSVKVTLFSGADDPDLPEHVKGLPVGVRSRWVNTYNWGVMDTQDDEDAQEQADQYTTMSVDDISELLGNKEGTPSATVPPASGTEGSGVLVGAPPQMAWLRKLKDWLSQDDAPKPAAAVGVSPMRPLTLYKSADGTMHAVLVYSNNFKDREKEIFSEASHMEYVEASDAGEAPYPDLHLWHGGPATKWGTVETISYVNGFAVAGGVVDKGKEPVALALKEMADKGELAVSFGYLGLRGSDAVYQMYRPFEISPLPVGSEANPWTAPLDFKENGMAFTDKKKAWFKEHFKMTDADIVAAEKGFEGMSAALKSANIGYREGAGETPPPPPTPPDPPPAPPPPSPAAGEDGIMPQIVAMTAAIKEIAGVVGALATEVKGMKEAAPAAAAAAADNTVLARIAGGPGFSPANDKGNVISGSKEQGESDWLDDIFKGTGLSQFGQPAAGAAIAAVPAASGANGEVK